MDRYEVLLDGNPVTLGGSINSLQARMRQWLRDGISAGDASRISFRRESDGQVLPLLGLREIIDVFDEVGGTLYGLRLLPRYNTEGVLISFKATFITPVPFDQTEWDLDFNDYGPGTRVI